MESLAKRIPYSIERERHNPAHTVSKFHPELGDFVIMKADNKNCGT